MEKGRTGKMYKIATFVILAGLAIMFVRTAYLGLQSALTKSDALGGRHETHAKVLFWFMVVFVAFLELGVRLRGGSHKDALFWAHICLAVPLFVVLLVMRFWLTGEVSPGIHLRLGLLASALMSGVVATGIPMIYRS